MPVLSVRGLSIDYITRKGPVHAVRDVSFELEKSETLAIIGESGSGKTTLAVGLIRLSPRGTKVTSGEILYTKSGLTTDVRTLDDEDLREYRWAEAAMVFQAALNSFKQSAGLNGDTLTPEVVDRLGVVDEIATAIGEERGAARPR